MGRGRVGQERSVEVQVGGLFGVDLRPTRLFVWLGPRRRGERILWLGAQPRISRTPRRRHELSAGPVRVSALGNPIVTLGQTGLTLARVARARRSQLADAPRRDLLP